VGLGDAACIVHFRQDTIATRIREHLRLRRRRLRFPTHRERVSTRLIGTLVTAAIPAYGFKNTGGGRSFGRVSGGECHSAVWPYVPAMETPRCGSAMEAALRLRQHRASGRDRASSTPPTITASPMVVFRSGWLRAAAPRSVQPCRFRLHGNVHLGSETTVGAAQVGRAVPAHAHANVAVMCPRVATSTLG